MKLETRAARAEKRPMLAAFQGEGCAWLIMVGDGVTLALGRAVGAT